jgi:hypothetical protein
MANKPSDKPSEASDQRFDQPSAKSDQPSATVQPDPCKHKVLDGSDGSSPSSSGGTVLGFAQPGVRCDLCSRANIGESVMRIRLRGDVYDLHQHCADSYIIKMGWTVASVPPAFEVLGPVDQEQKCKQCGNAKGASRIKRGIVTYVLHEVDCAPDYFAAHPDDDDGLGPM